MGNLGEPKAAPDRRDRAAYDQSRGGAESRRMSADYRLMGVGGGGRPYGYGRGRRQSPIYWVYYGVTFLIFTAFVREYMRVEELGMILTNCAVEKHSINSQMDILYEQRMSLKTLIEREREIHLKVRQDWEQDKGTTIQKLQKCESSSKMAAKKLADVTKRVKLERLAWAEEKKALREGLLAKHEADLKAKLGPLAESLAKYRSDADKLKGKLRECVAEERDTNAKLKVLIRSQNRELRPSNKPVGAPVITVTKPKPTEGDDFI